MARSIAIHGADDFVTAEPEEVEALRAVGMISPSDSDIVKDARVQPPFELADVVDSLKEMRRPDTV